MKKGFLLLLMVLFLTGCQNINQSSYEQIIANGLTKNTTFKNRTSQGYSYYLPKGLIVIEDSNNNVTLKSEKYNIYMYVDIISYYHKVENQYTIKTQSYYSQKIEKDGKFGYLEINLQGNDKYLIEIMYNYAKIEVIVNNKDIREMLAYVTSLLGTITYNDKIIENMVEEDVLNYNENEYNIFETAGKESNIENFEEPIEQNIKDVIDTDLIN